MTDAPVEKYLRTIHDNMKQRCLNPNHESYPFYGGAHPAVQIYPPWLDFETFKEDILAEIGPRPSNHTREDGRSVWEIDRINSYGNYEPKNLRWLHWRDNQANKRMAKKSRKKRTYLIKNGENQLPDYLQLVDGIYNLNIQ